MSMGEEQKDISPVKLETSVISAEDRRGLTIIADRHTNTSTNKRTPEQNTDLPGLSEKINKPGKSTGMVNRGTIYVI